MDSRFSTAFSRTIAAIALGIFFVIGIAAQDDPDPNSPAPILLSETDSTRALAQTPRGNKGRTDLSKMPARAFFPNTKVELFATDLKVSDGERANAFRLYVENSAGQRFRFPVLDIERIAKDSDVYRVTVQLRDEIGFWDQATWDGDVLIYLSWRGMASNRVRLGIGRLGGDIKDDPEAKPTPVGTKAESFSDKTVSSEYVGYRWGADRMRFLEQATFGPTATLENRIRRIGLRTWINEQFVEQYPSISNPYPSDPLKPGTPPSNCDGEQTTVPDVPVTCFRDTYSMYKPQTWFFKEAFYGDAQLRHRVAWALAQIWVTSGVDIQQGRHMAEYHKILANNAFGNYRDLMKEMTLNPTMGAYLDMAISTRTNPNENYAREIMQLFTVGLFMLNQDGTLQMSGGNPIPTYDQNGVNDLTRVLTGWRFCSTVGATCPNLASGAVNYIDPMVLNIGVNANSLNNNLHDTTAKTLLNYPGSGSTMNISACANCAVTPTTTAFDNIRIYANNSIEQALDNIFKHPNVGPFVSKILIQHMVTSDPSPAYVERVAAKFNDNGLGIRGDMKAVVKAVLLDPEARGDVKTDPNYGKLREPVQFTTNIMRAFNVRSANGAGQSDGYMTGRGEFTGMAQTPFMSPTVFNYFPPDYGVPGTALVGPEFAILTTGTAIQRTNFVNRFVYTSPAISVSQPNSPDGLSLDFSDLQALSAADATGGRLLDELDRRLMHSTMSSTMKDSIKTAVTSIASTDTLGRVRQAIYLVTTSSQFQVQR